MFVPVPLQTPFAARCNQPIGHQDEQDLLPARALAPRRQTLTPEGVQREPLPQRPCQPHRAPLPWPAQLQLPQAQAHHGGTVQQPIGAILRKQRQATGFARARVEHLDRAAPSALLRVVDLAQVQHVPLQHAPVGEPPVLDDAPVAMGLAFLLAGRGAQKHGHPLSAQRARWKQARSALQAFGANSSATPLGKSTTYNDRPPKIAKIRGESAKLG